LAKMLQQSNYVRHVSGSSEPKEAFFITN